MGMGIAQLISSADIDVVLIGRTRGSAQRAREDIARRIEKREPERAPAILEHLEAAELRGGETFDIVIEAIVEHREAKVELLRQLGPMAPVLATNTSSLSVSDLGAASGVPDRLIGLHFFNPPMAMKLVEVVMGRGTGEHAKAVALELIARLDRTAVQVKDAPGFVVNRLLFAQLGEACRAVDAGVATARDIDNATTTGLGHPMGPFALMDLIGLDVCLAIFGSLSSELGQRFELPAAVVRLVAGGRLGRKTRAGFFDY